MKTFWLIVWLVFGLYCVISAHGGGGASSAFGSMLAGLMIARNLAGWV